MDKFSGWLKKLLVTDEVLYFFDNPTADLVTNWFSLFFSFALLIFLLYVSFKLFNLWYRRKNNSVDKSLLERLDALQSDVTDIKEEIKKEK